KALDQAGQPLQAYISLVDLKTGERVYNGRPDGDGTFLLYAMEGSRYELAVDPERGDRTYFATTLNLTVDPLPQVEKVTAVLKPVMPGDELILSNVAFRQYSAEPDLATSQRGRQRLAEVVTSHRELRSAVEVLFEGYQEDSPRIGDGLTETKMDPVHWLYGDVATLGPRD